MKNFTLTSPEILWLELLVAVFFFWLIITRIKQKKNLLKFAKENVLFEILNDYRPAKRIVKILLMLLALSILIVAMAKPRYYSYTDNKGSSNSEVIIALDISNSMLVRDESSSMSRLDMAKIAISKFLDKLQNENVGLIVFAGQAVVQIPITQDYNAFKIMLSSIDPSFISAQGTSIAEAINLATNLFSSDKNREKILIIISDGEDHEGNIDEALKNAKEQGIKIYTVGIGSPLGNVIYLNNQVLLDENGKPVISKLNEAILKHIAEATGGKYYSLSSNLFALEKIYKDLAQNTSSGNKKIKTYVDKFHYFVYIVIFILFFEFFILERTNRWLSKFEIFKPNKKL